MNNDLNVGDTVRIVATKHELDKSYVGLVGVVAQICQSTKDILIEGKYITLHPSTIIHKVEDEPDESLILNSENEEGMFHTEFSMDKDGQITAILYTKQTDGNYKETERTNINTLIWKHWASKGLV